ncbi:hypothetical protein SLA2020_003150 [Shorea laevis]
MAIEGVGGLPLAVLLLVMDSRGVWDGATSRDGQALDLVNTVLTLMWGPWRGCLLATGEGTASMSLDGQFVPSDFCYCLDLQRVLQGGSARVLLFF